MNASDLSLKDLEYILAVSETGSFTQAAEICAVSQPALSKQISKLETGLGIQLFERHSRQVLLTEKGARFVQQARAVLDEAQKLLDFTQQNRKPLSGAFRIGAIASVCPYLLPHFIPKLPALYPELQLSIKENLTEPLIEDLKKGNLDAVIAARTFEEPLFSAIPLYFEPFVLAYNESVGFSFQNQIEVSDIDTSALLLLEDGHCLKDQTLEVCRMQENVISKSFKATSLETLMQMTAVGLGLSILPKMAVPGHHKFGKSFKTAEFANRHEGRIIELYFRKTSPNVPDFKLLSQLIKTQLPASVRAL